MYWYEAPIACWPERLIRLRVHLLALPEDELRQVLALYAWRWPDLLAYLVDMSNCLEWSERVARLKKGEPWPELPARGALPRAAGRE